MMLQLNPTIPVYIPEKDMNGFAYVLLDEGQEHDSLFLVGDDMGELWWYKQSKIRLQNNITLERINK